MYAQSLKADVKVAENGDVTVQLPHLVKSGRLNVIDATGNTVVQVEIHDAPIAPLPAADQTAQPEADPLAAWRKKREEYRQKFIAAGLMREDSGIEIPKGARRLTVEERMKLGTLPPGARSSLDLINEDREDRA